MKTLGRTILLFVPFLVLGMALLPGYAGKRAALPQEDKVRIAEAFRLADSIDNRLWPDWDKAPFGILLIAGDYEYLINHPHATNNFDTLGFDPQLHSLVLVRQRLFPANLLATFPAINGISTVVVGQAANTSVSSSTAWVVTVLHEHFHQYQQSQADYYSSVEALELSGGDETGKWMLNYPFPYGSAGVDSSYADASRALWGALQDQHRGNGKDVKPFLDKLRQFRHSLSPADFKYFSFQCWQEGVARYTELRVAELAAEGYVPSDSFRSLQDYCSFGEVADSLRARIFSELSEPSLAGSKRLAFYSFGAGEALLLDTVRPGWKAEYFREKFHLEHYF